MKVVAVSIVLGTRHLGKVLIWDEESAPPERTSTVPAGGAFQDALPGRAWFPAQALSVSLV